MSLRFHWGSLRNKIIIWAFAPATIILVIVALISLYAYQQVTEDLVIERDQDLTHLSARLLSAELKSYTDPLSGQLSSVFDSGIVVFDENGKVLAAEPEQLEGWGPDWAKRISFRQMLGSNKPVFSNVVVDGLYGQEAIVLVIPFVGRDGKIVGGTAGLFRLQHSSGNILYKSIEGIRRRESNTLYLVDGNGKVIYHSNPDYIGKDFGNQVIVQQVLLGNMGAFRSHNFAGEEIVASFAPVPDTPWGLVSEEKWANLIQDFRRYRGTLLVLLAMGIVVPSLIVTFAVRRITKPVVDLIGAAQQVAGGNFGQRIEASTGDEIEELAKQFNLMASQLHRSYENLENQVANRTKELATLNRLAAVVSQSLNLAEVINNALDEAMEITGMTAGQVFILERETQELLLTACRGISDRLAFFTHRMPLGKTTAGLAAQEGRPVFRKVVDYPKGKLRDLVWNEGIQLVISIPLMSKGETLGAIDLGAHTLRLIGPDELALLAAIGHQIGVAVENAQLYEQAQQLATVQERNRLARDLHDSVMQSLYGMSMYSEAAVRQLESGQIDTTASHLREIQSTAQDALREMRLLIFELRPSVLKREGLTIALRSRLEAVEERVGIETTIEIDPDIHLAPETEQELYRVAQEALNNALKHAKANHITVRLLKEHQKIILEVTDDGTGFDPSLARERGGFGFQGMKERVARLGGKLAIQSAPGKGTQIKVEVPQ